MVIRNKKGTGKLIHIKKGVTHRVSLEIIAYGIKIFPLLREIHEAHTDVTQTWYSNDVGSRGYFGSIKVHPEELIRRVLYYGYLPNPNTRILVISTNDIPQANA